MDNLSLEEAVDMYINSRRWDTLVGRAWDMHSPEGREELGKFLVDHIDGVLNVLIPDDPPSGCCGGNCHG